jgi:hypothetical protein
MRITRVKNCFFAVLAAAVFTLIFAGCEDPVKGGTEDPPPASGTMIFRNQSSYTVTIVPDPDFPNQGWVSFSLSPGASKTIYISLNYGAVYYFYNPGSKVKVQRLEEGKDIFIFVNL